MMELECSRDICTFYQKQLSISGETFDTVCHNDYEGVNVSLGENSLIDASLLYTFKVLLNKYRKRMGDASGRIIVSGGLQQYLNKQSQKHSDPHQEGSRFHQLPSLTSMQQLRSYADGVMDACRHMFFVSLVSFIGLLNCLERTDADFYSARTLKYHATARHSTLPSHVLLTLGQPVNVKLHIFSYLDAKQLCRVSGVCRDWYNVSQDNILWHGMLERDIGKWDVISHTTNPAVYQETQSEWSNKNIYLRCSPMINQLMHEDISMIMSITNMLRYFMPKKVPRITMFGPGLESDNTSAIIRNLLYEKNLLQRTGLVPGQFEGVGSGWGMKMEDGTAFQLSVLYSASKQVRQQEGWDRLHGNNLVQASKDEAGQVIMELKPAVRDFCRTVDAFVYVVDATADVNCAVEDSNQEFNAMVNERWSATHVPVLVLACVRDSSVDRTSCIKVVKQLGMSNMNRPWQVRNSEAAELTNVLEGLKWLVEQSQRR